MTNELSPNNLNSYVRCITAHDQDENQYKFTFLFLIPLSDVFRRSNERKTMGHVLEARWITPRRASLTIYLLSSISSFFSHLLTRFIAQMLPPVAVGESTRQDYISTLKALRKHTYQPLSSSHIVQTSVILRVDYSNRMLVCLEHQRL